MVKCEKQQTFILFPIQKRTCDFSLNLMFDGISFVDV